MSESEPNPVESKAIAYDVHMADALGVMIAAVAVQKDILGEPARLWVDVVKQKLNAVGVHTLKDYMTSIVTINHTLLVAGYPRGCTSPPSHSWWRRVEMVIPEEE
jgi:hypothetical protein